MVFVGICFLIFSAAYLLIRLAARRCGAPRFWKLLLIGAQIGAAVVTPLMICAPKLALEVQTRAMELLFGAGELPSLAGLPAGHAGLAPWRALASLSGVSSQNWMVAILTLACALLGIYLGGYGWLRMRRKAAAGALYSSCSFAVAVLPWLVAAGLLIS